MSKKQLANHSPTLSKSNTFVKPSSLDRFPLTFEYDRTIKEIKHDVHLRTI